MMSSVPSIVPNPRLLELGDVLERKSDACELGRVDLVLVASRE